MIHLNAGDIVGKGSERCCYVHPGNADRCIKVAYRASRNDKQNRNEIKYLKRLQRNRIDWSHIPRCHGWVETSVGVGLVYDYFHTEDGLPMPGIGRLVTQGRITRSDLAAPLEQLRQYLLSNRIVVRDLKPSNVVCDADAGDSLRLYLIDGIGNGDFVKVADYIPIYARTKIERHWRRFMAAYDRLTGRD